MKRCCICRFMIPVWYRFDGQPEDDDNWYCFECVQKQLRILGRKTIENVSQT